jgi:hypothetical protein
MQRYHKIVVGRSWRKTMNDVVGKDWPSRFVRWGAYVLTGYFCYLWFAYIDQNSTVYEDYQIALMGALGVGLSLFVFGFLLNVLWLIPWAIWNENVAIIDDMGQRLRPRLSINAIGPQTLRDLSFGHVNVSWAGTRQLIATDVSQGITLSVENPGATSLSNVQAYLARFRRVGEASADEWDTVTLPFVPVDRQIRSIDLPSGGSRRIWLFRVINNRPQFMTTDMPLGMAQALQDRAEYEGLIVVTATGVPASHYPFTMICDAPENAPLLTLTRLD